MGRCKWNTFLKCRAPCSDVPGSTIKQDFPSEITTRFVFVKGAEADKSEEKEKNRMESIGESERSVWLLIGTAYTPGAYAQTKAAASGSSDQVEEHTLIVSNREFPRFLAK